MPLWVSWTIFFIIVFSVYGSGHYYLYSWLTRLLSIPPRRRFSLKIIFFLLGTSFILVRFLAPYDFNPFLFFLALLSSLWVGFFFYFLLAALGRDLLAFFFLWGQRKSSFSPRGRRRQVWAVLAVVIIIMGWGTYEAREVTITKLEIPLRALPRYLDGLSLVQISDIHYGMINGNELLLKIVSMVNSLSPDMIVITGDLVDESVAHMEEMAAPLAQLHSRLGVWAITGNHEFYAGVERVVTIMKRAQIKVLRNEKQVLWGDLQILGIDDPSGARRRGDNPPEIHKLLALLDPEKPSIFLCHQPIYFTEAAAQRVGLQLSGHTHGGQLFPAIFISRLIYPLTPGIHRLKDSYLYVSRGVGTWGPPLRVGSKPEIVFIRLRTA